jgi:GNAT superfamily N-acetyltransferase
MGSAFASSLCRTQYAPNPRVIVVTQCAGSHANGHARLSACGAIADVTLRLVPSVQIVPYAQEHRAGTIALFAAELWPSYTRDPARTCAALRAPGATSLVALDGDAVVGVVQVQSDGAIQAHLSTLVVARSHRRRGIGRRLLADGLRAAGGERLDVLSIADPFYASMTNRRFNGWRLTRADLGLE